MVQIKNRQNQPLSFNINDKESVHFGAKEVVEIQNDKYTTELKNAVKNGDLIVLKMD